MRKIALIAVAFFFANLLWGQDTTSFNFTFNHLALSVKDVDRSAEFYIKVLKLREITNRSKIDGIRWFSLSEGKELHLISVIKETFATNKAIHLGLTSPDFEGFIKRLESLKINYSDWPGIPNKINLRADGVKQVYFQDPDGYWIEINSAGQK